VGFEAVASLAVAALDLKLVELLRQAANGGQKPGGLCSVVGGGAGGTVCPAAVFEHRPHIHPEPTIEPRPVIHPTPRIEPRKTLHPTAQLQEFGGPGCPTAEVTEATHPTGGIDASVWAPPWRKPVWETPVAPPPRVVKVVQRRTDVIHKGTLIDFFI
jgi:hypothetical protein